MFTVKVFGGSSVEDSLYSVFVVELELRSLPMVGDEILFLHHQDVCNEIIIPKIIKRIEAYYSYGDEMPVIKFWEDCLYEKCLKITRRIYNPDGTVELRADIV